MNFLSPSGPFHKSAGVFGGSFSRRTDTLPAPVGGQSYAVELTDLYNAWQRGACPNYGVQLRPGKVSNEYFNQFYSSRYTNNPSLGPKLVVMAPK